jgi:NAD(P)-dependent dehydrogenase (short-subunit alcohol dehydrogenase family)
MKKVALITGSTSGIGAAIARRFSQEGITVALHSKTSVQAGETLAKELPQASYTQADLSDAMEIKQLVASVLKIHGRLDILVNNAGISEVIPHFDLKAATPDLWQRLYAVNVIAPWMLISEAQEALLDAANQGSTGSIINISSHAGVRPKGASIPYAASKAALNHMTKLLARTLAPQIRVNVIAPGLVDTPMTQTWKESKEQWRTHSPMQRGASPEEIADIAWMLTESSYLTGEIIVADGGLNLL